MPPFRDPLATRLALEQQLALLLPIADHLHTVADAPNPIAGAVAIGQGEWRGPTADAAESFVAELRRRLRVAAAAADEAVTRVRTQIAVLA